MLGSGNPPPLPPRDGHGPSHPPLWLWCGAMVVVVVGVIEEVEVEVEVVVVVPSA